MTWEPGERWFHFDLILILRWRQDPCGCQGRPGKEPTHNHHVRGVILSNMVYLYNQDPETQGMEDVGLSPDAAFPLLWCLLFLPQDLVMSPGFFDGGPGVGAGPKDDEDPEISLSCALEDAFDHLKVKRTRLTSIGVSEEMVDAFVMALKSLKHKFIITNLYEFAMFFDDEHRFKSYLADVFLKA